MPALLFYDYWNCIELDQIGRSPYSLCWHRLSSVTRGVARHPDCREGSSRRITPIEAHRVGWHNLAAHSVDVPTCCQTLIQHWQLCTSLPTSTSTRLTHRPRQPGWRRSRGHRSLRREHQKSGDTLSYDGGTMSLPSGVKDLTASYSCWSAVISSCEGI